MICYVHFITFLNSEKIQPMNTMTTMHRMALTIAMVVGVLSTVPDFASASRGLERVSFGEDALIYATGGIFESLSRDGAVSNVTGDNQTTGNRRLLGRGDVIYVNFSEPEQVSVGSLFSLYRRIQEVFHPANGEFLGNLFHIVGVVEVMESGRNPATVKIVQSYGSIYPGDPVMAFVPPPISEARMGTAVVDGEGMIVAIPPSQSLIAQRNVVYIDWGEAEGLRSGDRLEVFRESEGLPRRVIGELKVLGVHERTSSALITKSMFPHLRGDRFIFKKAAPEFASRKETLEDQDEKAGQPASLSSQGSDSPRVALVQDGDKQKIILEGLVDHLEFDSGEAEVKPEGMKILNRVSEILKGVTDRHIRIEGHTDNVEIGPTLIKTFPTNWELSKARATTVVRYLVQAGGIDAANLSTVGYAATQPIATNATEEGRQKNRRVEIVLYPVQPGEMTSDPRELNGKQDVGGLPTSPAVPDAPEGSSLPPPEANVEAVLSELIDPSSEGVPEVESLTSQPVDQSMGSLPDN